MVCEGITSIFCYLLSTAKFWEVCALCLGFPYYFPKSVGAGEVVDKMFLGNVLNFKIKLPNKNIDIV